MRGILSNYLNPAPRDVYCADADLQSASFNLWFAIIKLNKFLNFKHMGIRNKILPEIVANPEEYLYSSARDYSGEKGLVHI